MNIDIRAKVLCTDGPAGCCTRVILKPASLRVTYIVVQESNEPDTERLVPLDNVISSDADGIKLGCARCALTVMDRLVVLTHVRAEFPDYPNAIGAALMDEPAPEDIRMVLEPQVNIAPDEMAIDNNMRIEATDGWVGQLDQLEVEPESGRITSFVMRTGHVWEQKAVKIPADQIDRVEEGVTFLKLDRLGMEALPAVPISKQVEN